MVPVLLAFASLWGALTDDRPAERELLLFPPLPVVEQQLAANRAYQCCGWSLG